MTKHTNQRISEFSLFKFLKIIFILENNAEPDEMLHAVAF